MSTITEAVDLVENKLKILLENYNFLKEENDLLYGKLTVLENQNAKEKQLLSELENKYQTLKIAKTIEGSGTNTKDTKLKINSLIKEIDKCIIQLQE